MPACRHADTYICMEEYADVSSCIKHRHHLKHQHVSTMACNKRCRCVDINFTSMIIMLPYCLCRHADTYICMEEYADVSSCIKHRHHLKHLHVSTTACNKRCRCVDINFTSMIIMLPYCLCRHAGMPTHSFVWKNTQTCRHALNSNV